MLNASRVFHRARHASFVGAAVAVLLPVNLTLAGDEASGPKSAASGKQLQFSTPEQAVDALLEAFKNEDEKALLDIFGHEHEKLIVVSDKIARSEALRELCQAAEQLRELRPDGDDDNTRILVLGEHDWPFPIPLVKESAGWRFDTAAGADEILNRRIGGNELGAIAVCDAYVDAQMDYAGEDRDADEVREFAQRFSSSEGKRDGLYWEVDPEGGEELSPLGPLLADATAYLEARKTEPIPYKGYYYKLLTRQGENPPGGKYDYVINGNMIAGFAMVACPADYAASGMMTFLVSHQGTVYQKDVGDKTHEVVKSMTEYNPDATWTVVEAGE